MIDPYAKYKSDLRAAQEQFFATHPKLHSLPAISPAAELVCNLAEVRAAQKADLKRRTKRVKSVLP
jgi:hypothetical protein